MGILNIKNNNTTWGDEADKMQSNFDSLFCVNSLYYSIPPFVKSSKYDFPLSDFNRDTVTLTDYYLAFDRLADAHKPYFRKCDPIGQSNEPSGARIDIDPNVYDINLYEFAITGLSSGANKMILCAGIHGDDLGSGDMPQSIISLYYFIRDLCENYEKSEVLTNIHESCRIYVIPILNPWGVQNRSRYNGRNIDLNRNYDINFSTTGQGSEPFSESESIAVVNFIENNLDTIYCFDFHSRGLDIIPNDARFADWSPDDVLQKKLYNDVKAILTAKYTGNPSTANSILQQNANASLYAWLHWIKNIPSSNTELFASINEEILTFQSEEVNRENLHYLALLVQYAFYLYAN